MGELCKRGSIWWIRYYRAGRRYEESAGSEKKGVAIDLLKVREGDSARGVPVTPKIGRLRFEEAAEDLQNDYRTNGKRSLDEVTRRIDKHLAPYFGGRRMAAITTADIRSYVAERQAATSISFKGYEITRKDGTTAKVPGRSRDISGASNAEINRELTLLKRMFGLAIQAGKLLHKRTFRCSERTTPGRAFSSRSNSRASSPTSRCLAARHRVRVHHRLAHRERSAAP